MTTTFTADQVREMLRLACSTRPSIAAWARDHEQHAPFVQEMLTGRKPISKRVASLLGLRKVTMWEVDPRANNL